ELTDDPHVVGIAERETVEVHVARLDARVERALGERDVLGNARRRPGLAAVLRPVDDAFLAGDPRRLGIETAHGEERPLRAGILAHPALAAVRGADDA